MARRRPNLTAPPETDDLSYRAGSDRHERNAAGNATTLLRMDNVLLVVEDLDAAIVFFTELGMRLEGRMVVEGAWVDRTIGIDGARSEIALLRMPDGHGGIELDRFITPAAARPKPGPDTVNAIGYRRIMFAVDDIDEVVARLKGHGAELVDEIVRYEDAYRLCYMRGPEGILVGIAEELGEGRAG
jgi:catechol 2,3-dioxygenase-like lactoylglutathione lyase family enzyme